METPSPTAELHLANEPEMPVKGRSELLWSSLALRYLFLWFANLGLLAFGIGWLFDWPTALDGGLALGWCVLFAVVGMLDCYCGRWKSIYRQNVAEL
jgi:hypothetical protein